MKAEKAFTLTLKFSMEFTNFIVSFGYDKLSSFDNYLALPLFFLGKLARYVIGFPLGILAGILAAGFVAIANLVKSNKKKSIIISVPLKLDALEFNLPELSLPTNSSLVSQVIKQSKIREDAFEEKKSKLTNKINLLINRINEKIALLSPQCKTYDRRPLST